MSRKSNCLFCGQVPLITNEGPGIELKDGYYDIYKNSETIASGDWIGLFKGIDPEGELIIFAEGDMRTDFYYPKFCPECGRDLRKKGR